MTEIPPGLGDALTDRYRIEGTLGEGGMATVYLAEDLKHQRKVALKVLKPELAAVVGSERFLTEIRTTAHLQHPHILPLFDSGEASGFLYYVMPYVEGESLRDRLDRETQLPVGEAVRLGLELAEALEYAHEQGVVHRDIKPANILLQGGQPLIADFGIALAVGSPAGSRLTETGVSLGTPYYMSPEQATGDRPVGPASDIYALASVLFEMLVGEPPYPGSTAQAVLGKIIAGGPVSVSARRRTVPTHVDAAIRKALEEFPADRFPSASSFAGALTDETFRYADRVDRTDPAGQQARRPLRALVMTAVAAGIVTWALTTWIGGPREGPADTQVIRYSVPVDPSGEARLGNGGVTSFGPPASRALALSPDGATLAYDVWRRDENGDLESLIFLRRLDQETVTPLAFGGPAATPVFSPDGLWLGFVDGVGTIRRRSMRSGEVEVVVAERAGILREFGWSTGGEIVFIDPEGRLMRVPEAGGEPEAVDLGALQPDETRRHPAPVPGTSLVLYSRLDFRSSYTGEVRAVDLDTGDHWLVVEDAMDAQVAGSGRVLFMRRGALMAAAFDPEAGRVVGTAVTVLDDVLHALGIPNWSHNSGTGQYAVSRSGHLAYASGGTFPRQAVAILQLSPDGVLDTLDVDPRAYAVARIAPDGSSLALTSPEGLGRFEWGLHVYDLRRGVTRLLNTGGLRYPNVEWSPDGSEIAYTAREDGRLHLMPVNGDVPTPIPNTEDAAGIRDWASNGDVLYDIDWQLWALKPDGQSIGPLGGEPPVYYGVVSPDGRWLAYATRETDRMEIYVRPYGVTGAPTRVSTDGGYAPAWAHDGLRLYFRDDDDAGRTSLYAVDVTPGGTFEVGLPYRAVDPWPMGPTLPMRSYDVGPDGSFYGPLRSGLNLRDRHSVDEIRLFLNFDAALEQRLDEGEGD